MKNFTLFTLLIAMVGFGTANAQNDTLLWEDFEFPFLVDGTDTSDYIVIDFPQGESLYPFWVNFDGDGLADGSGADRDFEWFRALGFADQDSTNVVMASNSWLSGGDLISHNWLISHRVSVTDDQAMLYWKSAPFQTPRYVDGYYVLVSTDGNEENNFTDTIAVFREFDGPNTTDNEDTLTYAFTSGIVHTEVEIDTADLTRSRGVLQQWSASLAAYDGQDIYVAMYHGCHDDNLLSVDDILVLGTGSVGIDDVEEFELGVYPNPASSTVNVGFRIFATSRIWTELVDMSGKKVSGRNPVMLMPGDHKLELNVDQIESGNYLFNLHVNDRVISKQISISH
jgi:hypothetical protein